MATQLIECVPNFSEGRNADIIDRIVAPFRNNQNVKLLDYQPDEDHNRLVVTVLGEPARLIDCLMAAVTQAVALIDMNNHRGHHPRMGAVDVVPFVPIRHMSMAQAVTVARQVGNVLADRFSLPVFLYDQAATAPERKNLSTIRAGEFEKMPEKLKQAVWKPDFGPAKIHPTAGVTAVGARNPLVAFNVNLNTNRLDIATHIAKAVRFKDGGLRYCKAMAVPLKTKNQVQISMNMTDFSQTALYRTHELIRTEARRYGVSISGSEIVGLVPMAALIDSAAYYLGLSQFSVDQVLETHLLPE